MSRPSGAETTSECPTRDAHEPTEFHGPAGGLRWLAPVLDTYSFKAWVVEDRVPARVLYANRHANGEPPPECARVPLPEGLVLLVGQAAAEAERFAHFERAWRLTARQRAVLRELLGGAANKEIAVVMRVSVSMIEQHLRAIFRKARVDQRGALISAFWSRQLPASTDH